MTYLYEIMLILRPEGTEEHVKQVVARAEELIKKEGGTLVASDPWGRRRLTFPIRKQREGLYHVFRATADATAVARMQRGFRLEESTLRVMIVRAEELATVAATASAAAAAGPDREDWAR